MKKIYLGVFVILVLAGLGYFIWQVNSPKDVSSIEVKEFKVEQGAGLLQIAEQLEQEGIIKDGKIFALYVLATGRHIQAGSYSLRLSSTPIVIAKKMIQGDTTKVVVTILEGYTIFKIQEWGIPLAGLKASSFKKDFNFLSSVPDDASLEGFLFPDTYYFSVGDEAEFAAKTMLANFGEKLTPELREEIARQNKSIFDVVIMASIIEKEVRTYQDKELVSGLLWKRLNTGMRLQVDASGLYPGPAEEYDTYKFLGLPKGPICNPGLKSIEAAIYPKASQYWYYLSTRDGTTIFSKTFDEHLAATYKYLR